jgi:aryl-alcohol dehydrogenase-like predicted oxidoreductase
MKPLSDPTMKAMDDDLLALHRSTGLAVVAYTSQAGGFFSRVDAAGGRVPDALRASPYATTANVRLARVLSRLSRELGVPVSHLVLAWLLARDVAVLPVVGCRTVAQLDDSIAAAGVRLDAAVVVQLDAAADDAT